MAKLYFYYSAMNAGKSTNLLQSNYNYKERGMRTLLFTPAIDNRDGGGMIHSRIGLKSKAYRIQKNTDLYQYTEEDIKEKGKLHCILIDEVQFLTKEQIEQLTKITDQLNIPILAYGLRTDFQGELFPGSHYLLAWADEINEVKTMCHCGRKATMNMRIDGNGNKIKEGPQVQIGGNESYIATCRKHHKEGISK